MEKTISLIEVNQAIGTFYIGKMKSGDLIKISKTVSRGDGGIQREESKKRVLDIANYCEDPDATFPTPIIISVSEKNVLGISRLNELISNRCFEENDVDILTDALDSIISLKYDDCIKIAEILDGQHRIRGIEEAKLYTLDLPIVVMFDLTEEEKAYVFSTINSNQTKVDKALIYDLFELSTKRSPYKTCHEIARILNLEKNSPFYGNLKMLGKKSNKMELLSQGTFVSYLVKLISENPQADMIQIKKGKMPKEDNRYPLREYFLGDRDDIILKLIRDFFNSVKTIFPDEWNNDKYILSKTTGYGAMIKVFKDLYLKGLDERKLDQEFFEKYIRFGKKKLEQANVELTSEFFPSNEQMQSKLASYFNEFI